MSEISFQYKTKSEPRYEARFAYWPSESIEYGLVYQRYIALSDASTFNSPVAITKVATGLYQLYGLFVDLKPYETEYHNLFLSLDIVKDDMFSDTTQEQAHRTHYNLSTFLDVRNMALPLYVLNVYDDYYLSRHDTILNKYENPIASMDRDALSKQVLGQDIWLQQDYVLSKYSNLLLQKRYHNHLRYFQEWRHLAFTNHLDIMQSPGMLATFDKELNIYDTFALKLPTFRLNRWINPQGGFLDNDLSRLENIFMAPFDLEMNILPVYMLERADDTIHMNILPQIAEQYPRTHRMNIIPQIYGERSSFIGNINKTLICTPQRKYANAFRILFGKPGDKHGNVFKQVSGSVYLKHLDSHKVLWGYRHNNTAFMFQSAFVSKAVLTIGSQHNLESAFKDDNVMNYVIPTMVFRDKHVVSRFVTNTASKDKNTITPLRSVFAGLDHKILKDFIITTGTLDNPLTSLFEGIWMTADKAVIALFDNDVHGTKFNGGASIADSTFLGDNGKNITLYTSVSGMLGDKSVIVDPWQLYMYKDKAVLTLPVTNVDLSLDKKSIWAEDNTWFAYKDNHSIENWSQIFVSKDKASISVFGDNDFAYKDQYGISLWHGFEEANKDRASIFIQNLGSFGHKSNMSIEMHDSVFAFKNQLGTMLDTQMKLATKYSHSIYTFDDDWAFKGQHDIAIVNQLFTDKLMHNASLFRNVLANKAPQPVYIPDVDFVFKNEIAEHYIEKIRDSNFTNMIIPLSKVKHRAYIDSINSMVQKLAGNGYINHDVSGSVIPKDTSIPDLDLFCDKQAFDVYLDYKNTQITKVKVRGFVFEDVFVDKYQHLTALNASILVDKTISECWLNEEIKVHRKSYDGHIEGDLSTIVISRDIYCNNSIFVDKISQMCYYDYSTLWSQKQYSVMLDETFSVSRDQRHGYMLDCISPTIKKHVDTFYDYGVFTHKIIRESALFQQLHEVHTKAYDAGIRPDDFGNWAWVYETPDPFPGNVFGIDELLLPENDTRYEQFEDIIFNRQTMRPRNPVKVIDDHTFIAKFPIRHPLTSKHADIAVNYDDSAIKIEQFYGIETSVMHTIFLKFYRLWQSKIFEFGTMTMMQSVKLMMEYMYAWIMEYFSLDQLEQALRVFKLIRWYGETSIIQNSQYIISYEYDTLESKLTTGECLIPNNLNDPDATMYVDGKLGVIRNKPELIGQREASVTFEIKNKKNSSFTFSLSNTIGSVNIYINDALVDTVSRSTLNLMYELPYTGEPNIVRIEKPKEHNLNAFFYIGNIKVPNCTFKNLSIDFDPVLKAGNKPLNDIARKMIEYANLYEDRATIYEMLRKGNLGIGEIYKRLQEYWDLHHQDKSKGKRLTIKET